MKKYDIVFIGGGPSGYTGALRARDLGFSALLIEKSKVGGVCLQLGCIPTKALLASASLIDKITRAVQFGLEVRLDTPHKLWKISEKKDVIVNELTQGLIQTLKRKGVEILQGEASFKGPHVLTVKGENGAEEIEGQVIVIATGSRPQELPGIPFNHTNILSSDDMLTLREVPKDLAIIGGGVIGCEFASLFAVLGSKVSIVEMLPQILPLSDKDIAKRLEVLFKRRGIQVFTEKKMEKLSSDGAVLSLLLTGGERVSCDKMLISVGRRRNVENLGLENVDINVDKGTILVNGFLETSVAGVYAVGDVIGSPQLAHVAQAEAICVVDNLRRERRAMNYRGWPNTVFTHPEVASAGLSKEEAEKAGYEVEESRCLFGALGKSHVERETDGIAKLVFDRKTDKLLGGHIIGENASDLIAEISLGIRLGAKREDLVNTMHAHPTFSEVIWEASRNI